MAILRQTQVAKRARGPRLGEMLIAKGIITDEQLWHVAQYVRSLSPEKAPEVREVVRVVLLAQEAGIDERAVHYDKGCYLGQEAMAKIHFRGKVNRRLARVEGGSDLRPGLELTLDGSKGGVVTSAHGATGLALVRQDIEAGTQMSVGETDVKVVD